eukprot:COSAG01_NODE_31192_length_602_cov_0.439364_1_plen_133_part_10
MLEAKAFPGFYVCATPDGLSLQSYNNSVSFERTAVWRKAAPSSDTLTGTHRLELVSERGSFIGRQRHDDLSVNRAAVATEMKDLEVVFVKGLVGGRHTVSLELPTSFPRSYVVATTSTGGEPAGLAVRSVAAS